jgi:hypothetical protein
MGHHGPNFTINILIRIILFQEGGIFQETQNEGPLFKEGEPQS